MLANLRRVHRERSSIGRFELAARLKKFYQLGRAHASGGACTKLLVGSKLLLYGRYKLLARGVTVALHHVEDFVSVCHVLIIFRVYTNL